MSIKKESKLKKLLSIWPLHTLTTSLWLQKQGYSYQLIQRYMESGWIKPIASGVFVRAFDTYEWPGIIWAEQQRIPLHLGAKTALEIHGKTHFLKQKESNIYVFMPKDFSFHKWVQKQDSGVRIIRTISNFIPTNHGIMPHDFGGFSINVSSPARAIMEYLFLLDKKSSGEEAYFLMEGLSNIIPGKFQELLEVCQSVRVKRLTLCLAKKSGASWLQEINLKKIDLGAGDRGFSLNGKYDPEFKIVYPKTWDKNEKLEF